MISQPHERGSIALTTNRACKSWPEIFNNDSSLNSAFLDRLLHHAETVVIEGPSYGMGEPLEHSARQRPRQPAYRLPRPHPARPAWAPHRRAL
ncbi:MAG: ATP-binding protein [Candidatus Accumulibacter sp.]|nr:ATP-binding protein [Accumulibacter sp.]MCM8635946.1 ATP-binding protein [Accumulibacter sp.]MCM8639445.1 ATP-binding protein [Accumulibacter sp.]